MIIHAAGSTRFEYLRPPSSQPARANPGTEFPVRRAGEQELYGDPTLEDQVPRREHDAHAAHAEDTLDAVLAGKHVAGAGDAGQVDLVNHGM